MKPCFLQRECGKPPLTKSLPSRGKLKREGWFLVIDSPAESHGVESPRYAKRAPFVWFGWQFSGRVPRGRAFHHLARVLLAAEAFYSAI